jgi:4-aminobutyrate aminotransferase-like enzyme/Ser/Thr protein kinase RdoA (MazF antagonist)
MGQEHLTPAAVEALAATHYGLRVAAEELPAEYAQNFRLREDGGDGFVLKVLPEDEEIAVVDLQHRTLGHLAAAALPVATPRVVPTASGEEILLLDGGMRVRLLTYLPGELWVHQRAHPPALLYSLGAAMAAVDRALESFQHPAVRHRHPWNVTLARERWPWVEKIEDARHRGWVDDAFHRWAAGAEPLLSRLPRSVIHGDANDYNLLVSASAEGPRVSGLLDFGDMVESVTVAELAVALAYGLLDSDDPLRAGASVVAGYWSQRPLSAEEREALFPLTLARLAVSVVTAAHRRQTRPDEDYLFVTEKPAWALLERLLAVSPREAQEALFAQVAGTSQQVAGTSSEQVAGTSSEQVAGTSGQVAGTLPEQVAGTSGQVAGTLPEQVAGTSGQVAGTSPEALLARRQRRIGASLSVAYDAPLKIVRGRGPYLFDHRDQPYLDLVNNVCHVGHCHPRVVAAGARQMARLNTNTRYLYDQLTEYADRLVATLPEPLSVCYFVCSGSEANELALRLVRAHTGRRGIVVLEGAYHGHTTALIDISPYKFMGAGGSGAPEPHVQIAPMPDRYRLSHQLAPQVAGTLAATSSAAAPEALGEAYGDTVRQAIARGQTAEDPRDRVGAFLCESLLSCGGQILPPPGYLKSAYHHTRAAGGVCIADEVQVGFGRVGSHFWAFETQGVVPDIVVLGKPIGNGHPMAAVVTTPEIAASFANGMEFFSTFGGNPVSCAIGMAVLDVIEEEGLQDHARRVGQHAAERFRALQQRHPLIGDVRGAGLFLGIELVRDRETLEPAAEEATALIQRLRHRGILLSTDGPLHNVLKIKPPMVITEEDFDRVARELDQALGEFEGRDSRH